MDSVAIIGLGLIGGSIARDLSALGYRVTAFDSNAESLAAAHAAGCITDVIVDPLHALDCDVVILATPVRSIASLLASFANAPGNTRLVMDTGSTKLNVVAYAEAGGIRNFVGAHPLAGDHRSGWEASRTGLFRGATVFLCPAKLSSSQVVEAAAAFWEMLGARAIVLDAEVHDRRLALISHLPQVLASALGGQLAGHGITRADLGRGGRDMTRLASSDVRMWTDILMSNRAFVGDVVAASARRLSGLAEALESADEQSVRRLLEDGARLE